MNTHIPMYLKEIRHASNEQIANAMDLLKTDCVKHAAYNSRAAKRAIVNLSKVEQVAKERGLI